MKSLQTIGVIGIGTMGRGSAQIRAHAGLSVSMPDVDEQRVTRGHVEAAATLAKRLGKPPVMREKSVDSFGPAQNATMENYVVERLRGVLRGWPPA